MALSDTSDPQIASTDMTIFENIQQKGEPNCREFKSCIAINRLLSSLRYYQSLELQTSIDHQEIFTSFANEVYRHPILIQDFHHFQKEHDEQLQHIMEYAIANGLSTKCNINTCNYASRHYRVKDSKKHHVRMDPNLRFYADSLDSFHFYLFHLRQIGLRCININSANDNDANHNEYKISYDPEFAQFRDDISSTQDSSERFNRVSPGNKFDIKINDQFQDQQNEQEEDHDSENNITYLDSMIDDLHHQNVDEAIVSKLVLYLIREKYDTESVDLDLKIKPGNIANYLSNDEKCLIAVVEKFTKSRGKI